jgi:hypothetical protein
MWRYRSKTLRGRSGAAAAAAEGTLFTPWTRDMRAAAINTTRDVSTRRKFLLGFDPLQDVAVAAIRVRAT